MALGAALVDRGWIKRRAHTAAKIDGERQLKPEVTKPFRCRLQMVKGSEQQMDGRRKSVVRPTLLMGRKRPARAQDEVTVKSKEALRHYGVEEMTFKVDGDPLPLRKRRTVVGYEASLVKAT